MRSLFNFSFTKKHFIKVLIIEDNEDDALLLVRQLRNSGFTVQHHRVDTQQALTEALEQPWDLILADHSMPSMSGIDAIKTVRNINSEVPFVFVSGTLSEELAVEAIRMGAQDYILKDKPQRLSVVVRRELEDSKIKKERRRAEQQLNYLARYDSLTGLPNRFTFLEQIAAYIDGFVSGRHVLLVLHIRLNRLKSISDNLDYTAEETLLQEITRRLQQFVGENGSIARLPDNEFALIHTGFFADEHVLGKLEELAANLAKPYMIGALPAFCGASIGAVAYPSGAFDAEDMLRKAQIAALHAGNSSKGRVQFFEPSMVNLLEDRSALRRLLQEALQNKEFFLTYQPQIDMVTGSTASLVAAIEWHNPEKGLMMTDQFLPLAEETGFVFLLGEWAVRQVCQQIKLWEYSGLQAPSISLPISTKQFHDDNLVELMAQILKEYDLSPTRLRMEIMESAIMRDSEKASLVLYQLKDLGIKVVLDNFGDHYSNLAYLKNFVSDFIVIGPNFVQSLGKTPGCEATIATTVAMAQKLNIKTIAKGVETPEQYLWLKGSGCHFAQGSFTGGAAEPAVIRDRLREEAGKAN